MRGEGGIILQPLQRANAMREFPRCAEWIAEGRCAECGAQDVLNMAAVCELCWPDVRHLAESDDSDDSEEDGEPMGSFDLSDDQQALDSVYGPSDEFYSEF